MDMTWCCPDAAFLFFHVVRWSQVSNVVVKSSGKGGELVCFNQVAFFEARCLAVSCMISVQEKLARRSLDSRKLLLAIVCFVTVLVRAKARQPCKGWINGKPLSPHDATALASTALCPEL